MPQVGVTFVARNPQLQALDGALSTALSGKTTVCFVTGEAGAGKTALVREFGRRAEMRYERLVRASGSCSAFSGDADPYLPFREILAQLTGSADAKVAEGALTPESAGRLTGLLKRTSAALVEYGPALIEIFVPGAELAAKLGKKVVRRSGQAGSDGASVVDQGQIFEQYTNVLRRVASDSPLLVVLDDLHWVDPASVGLLFHLARRLGDAPILFVGTYRQQDVALGRDGQRHPLEPVVSELRRLLGDVVIDLDAAADSEDRELIDALIDVEPNRLGDDFRHALLDRTDGHPLFATELLRTMRERGDLSRDDTGHWIESGALDWNVLPARVEGVIAERMGRLPPDDRRLLRVGSVEGEEFSAEVVAAVEDRAPRDVVRALSSDSVKSHDVLRARGVLRDGRRRLTRYGFRHNLFQRWLYESIDESERSWLHEDVARALEELYGEQSPDVALQLARHYSEAGLLRKAFEYRLLAASNARTAHANQEAATGFEEALALLHRLESEEDRDSDAAWVLEVREQTLEALGDVLSHTGRHDRAREIYEEALAILPVERLVARGRIRRKMAQGLMQQHRMIESLAMYDVAAEALGPVGTDRSTEWWEERIEIRTARLWALYWAGTPEHVSQALALVEQTRPEVELHADARLRALFDSRVCILRGRSERYMPSDVTMDMSRAAFAAARDSGDSRTILDIEFLVGFYHLWRLEDEAAEPLLRSNLESATRVGSLFQRILALTYLAVLQRFRGQPEAVEELASACLADATHLGVGTYVGTSRANLSWVALRAGDVDSAREGAEAALDSWQGGIVYPLQWLALLPRMAVAYEEGDAAAVVSLAGRLLDPGQQRLRRSLERALENVGSAAGDADGGLEAGRVALQEARGLGLL